MNMKLGLKQKRFFKKYGFLLIPNILSSDEIKLEKESSNLKEY